jgi:hypothetical protein
MAARDTGAQAHAVQREAHRRLGAGGRVELAFEMSTQAREISIAGMRSRNPELSQAEARAQLLRRILGDDLYRSAYERKGS